MALTANMWLTRPTANALAHGHPCTELEEKLEKTHFFPFVSKVGEFSQGERGATWKIVTTL